MEGNDMRVVRPLLGSTIAAVLLVAGCDCGGKASECDRPENKIVKIVSPQDGAVLTFEDDVNPDRVGIQVHVEAEAKCFAPQSAATLVVNADANLARTSFVVNERVVFSDVTLEPGDAEGNVNLSVSVRDRETSVPKVDAIDVRVEGAGQLDCDFVNPSDGATLGSMDDVDPDTPGVQVDVALRCKVFEDLTGEPANLWVDGVQMPTAFFAGDSVVFENVSLSEGTNTLNARASLPQGEMDETITVTVDTPACEVRLQPMGSIVFNIAGDPPRLPGREVIADADGDPQNGIQADLAATTPDCQGGDAVLVVDGAAVATVPLTHAPGGFDRVTLPDGPRVSVYVD
ncbi:MAG: hypothetical protein D6729_00960, partial [Deltaproteobacteria bacterium]